MGEPTFFDRMISHVRATSKYYTGYPKDLGPSRVLHFTSEREFVQLLHQGYPVVVAFTIRCNYSKHLDKVLEEAAAEFYPNVKFMRVECPKYPGFCITRQRKDYPFIEIFHSPEHISSDVSSSSARQVRTGYGIHDELMDDWEKELQGSEDVVLSDEAANQGRIADPSITKYSVKVLPFNYDTSAYGFREFFKRHGIHSSDPK